MPNLPSSDHVRSRTSASRGPTGASALAGRSTASHREVATTTVPTTQKPTAAAIPNSTFDVADDGSATRLPSASTRRNGAAPFGAVRYANLVTV